MRFSAETLSRELEARCPQVVFAFLHGSAARGELGPQSDVDIALYLDRRGPSFETFEKAAEAVRAAGIDAEPDIGFLNGAEPVYRFEALKGKLLFCRDEERYVDFYSLTCREYESQMASYERQRRYRLEARH